MSHWKRIAALCLALFVLAAAGCSAKKTDMEAVLESGKLRVLMSPEFPPYEYKDADGNIVGADVEIAKRIAAMFGVELEIVECNYAELQEALLDGQGDMILSAFSVSKQYAEEIQCSDIYLNTAQYIITSAENTEIAAEADLEGKILGVQQYAQGDIYATDIASAKNIERFAELSEAVQVLLDGKLDAVIADQVTTEAVLAENSETLKKIYIGENMGHYCIGLRKDSAMLQEINALLATMQASGEIKTYVLQYTMAEQEQAEA